ncbi:MAG: argininosuccinate lyase [Gammaproteobacteria bacterium]|nr:MAG: argininosuccinate lyase [Gammaproteobacteria bacterium]
MDEQQKIDKPWAGRFTEATDDFVESFSASVHFDRRLYRHDIEGSIAHARMLAHVGVLTPDETGTLVEGLEEIRLDIERGDFAWLSELEDVHMNIEARLTDRVGDVGKKLHTGRSRNDQVATDLRLYVREQIDSVQSLIKCLQSTLLDQADKEAGTIMPGFTHLQAAQPVTFGHHLLAWFEMLVRDHERLVDCRKRVNRLPLGSAALAGTSFPIDRDFVAKQLNFEGVCENSLDAVSDRDFVIEFISCAAQLMQHLSRMAEELVLWVSPLFGFIELPDRFCTGSSIMPQKKNPDVPELIRGKSGRVYGALVSLLTLMKAQPLAYNRDNQEDKEPLFDTVDTVSACLEAMAGLVPGIEPQRDRMRAVASAGFSTATDLADYLARKGVPFRDAHGIVGRAVHKAIEQGCDLADMNLAALREFSDAIEDDVYSVLTLDGSIASRNHPGGTAPEQVRAAVARAKKRLGV